jgi:5-methylcytosine-specific restriction protein A
MNDKKRLPWRCANAKQARDKATIYNSREWQELRIAKLRSQPLCERCLSQGRYVSAHVVHHIVPIETAHTLQDMKCLAIDCGLAGLQSLCDQCHADIHNDAGYHTREAVQQRANERLERWQDKVMKRFGFLQRNDPNYKIEDNGIQTEIYEGPVRETGANRTYGAQAQTNAEGSGSYQDEMG